MLDAVDNSAYLKDSVKYKYSFNWSIYATSSSLRIASVCAANLKR